MELYYLWIILGVVMIIVEIFTFGFAAMCFAFGFFAIALAEALGISQTWQAVIFSAVSLLIFVSLRPFAKKYLYRSKESNKKANTAAMIGRRVLVTEKISADTPGAVKLDGDIWRALPVDGKDIAPGKEVIIEKMDGNTVFVKPA